MAVDLSEYLVIGISSRALFDLVEENNIYEKEGLIAYRKYQVDKENEVLRPGTGFPLIGAILKLNRLIGGKRKTEVVVMSKNSEETSLRITN